MAGSLTPLAISERSDIHKSCKALETLVNVLNDYCEAAVAIGSLQKKLARALKDTAGLKAIGETSANALNASATMFEALIEVHSKFTKFVDKECAIVSTDVKKWFKKLAKEEKAHDNRINSANARIKQAGQLYERKSKKSAREAIEEHARYVNLISSLGPEMSQDKYNHALLVSQEHMTTTFGVAACLARVADAEWLRACEEVRRFSPTVGQLGEWRALCEGGWAGPPPKLLPDIEDIPQHPRETLVETPQPYQSGDEEISPTIRHKFNANRIPSAQVSNSDLATGAVAGEPGQRDVPVPVRRSSLPSQPLREQVDSSLSVDQSLPLQPPRPLYDPDDKTQSLASIASLTSFPSPPSHFPIPPVFTNPQSQVQQVEARTEQPRSLSATSAREVDAPLPRTSDTRNESSLPSSQTHVPPHLARPQEDIPPNLGSIPAKIFTSTISPQTQSPQTERSAAEPGAPQRMVDKTSVASASTPTTLTTSPSGTYSEGDYLARGHEPGTGYGTYDGPLKSTTATEAARSKGVERTESAKSNGSVVAAIRNRYSTSTSAPSPAPKDVPRLPLSVSNLASRYQVPDGPSSPHRQSVIRPMSPQESNTPNRLKEFPSVERTAQPYKASTSASSSTTNDEELSTARQMRQQRNQELMEQELREKQQKLQEREHEIEQRARELERERARYLDSRGGIHYGGNGGLPQRPNQPMESPRPISQLDPPTQMISQPRYSYSTTNLVTPSPKALNQSHSQASSNAHSHYAHSQPSSPIPSQAAPEHAPFCGCDTCSIAKYRSTQIARPSPHDLRPPEPPINLRPEKPKGWMRRLSMPSVVGNAFSLDSKKGGTGGTHRNGVVMEDGRLGVRTLGAGISNQSMTNLGRR